MDHAALLAAIGRALGMAGPYEEWSGERAHEPRREVSAGAVDARGRVAWIEETVAPGGSPGSVPIDICLRIAAGGAELRLLPIESYNPFFGCDVRFLGWFGERVVAVYREKHRTLAWSVPVDPSRAPSLATLEDAIATAGDLAVFAGRERGLVEGISLPDLEPVTPLPHGVDDLWPAIAIDGADVVVSLGDTEDGASAAPAERLRLPSPEQRARPAAGDETRVAVEHALFQGTAPPFGSLVVATAAHPFWAKARPAGSSYEDVFREGPDRLRWLPAYWQRHLRGEEAAEALALLDRLAAGISAESGWDPSWEPFEGTVALAARHVRRRAAVLAEVCRTGNLPPHEWCGLWRAKPDLSDRPRAVRLAYETLAASPPKALEPR